MYEKDSPAVLPLNSVPERPARQRPWLRHLVRLASIAAAAVHLSRAFGQPSAPPPGSFFWTRNDASSLCPGVNGSVSHAGHIGLKGDSAETPRRSFYWCARPSVCDGVDRRTHRFFEAQVDPQNAPVVCVSGAGAHAQADPDAD